MSLLEISHYRVQYWKEDLHQLDSDLPFPGQELSEENLFDLIKLCRIKDLNLLIQHSTAYRFHIIWIDKNRFKQS